MTQIIVNRDILLETVTPSMAGIIFETLNRDRDVLKKWLPFVEMTRQVADTEKFIQSIENQKSVRKEEVFSIWYKQEFAGLIGLKDSDWINHKTELGYWLAVKMQGKGIMTTSIKKLADYSFKKLKMNRLQIKVAVGNYKSSAIPVRLGFTYEGIERQGEYHSGKYLDLEIYSLLKSEWQSFL